MHKKQRHLKQAAGELQRIEQGTPVLLENITFVQGGERQTSLLVITRSPHTRDTRNRILRWLVPAPQKRRIQLDPCGTFVVQQITGKTSTAKIIEAFAKNFQVSRESARASCLLFLHSLARRGIIAIIEGPRLASRTLT